MIKLYEHPDFEDKKEFYQAAKDLYEGNQKTLKQSKYLLLHELEKYKEGTKIRQVREERSAYTNFIEPILSMWVSLFFKKKPTLDKESMDMLGDLINDIDGEGTNLFAFVQKHLLPSSLLYGFPILRVNALGEKPKTLEDEQQKQTYRPYLQVIEPLSFRDWAVERKDPMRLNKLNFCRIEFDEMKLRASATDPIEVQTVSLEYLLEDGGLVVNRYIEKKEENKVNDSERKWELKETYPIKDWQEIPIIIDANNESWVKDLMPHCLKYYNLESTLDNICLYQAYQRVLIMGDDVSSKHMLGAAEYTWAPFPTGTAVQVIEPNSSTTIEARLSQVLNNIFRLALNQTRMMSSDSKVGQSSDTLKEEKEAVYNLVKAESEGIEDMVNNGLKMFAKFKGIDDLEPEFKFTLDSGTDDVDQFIKLVSLFRDEIVKLPTMRKELLNKVLGTFDLESNEEIQTEIETLVNQPVIENPELNIRNRLLNGFSRPQE